MLGAESRRGTRRQTANLSVWWIFPIAFAAYFCLGRFNLFYYRGWLDNGIIWIAGLGLVAFLVGSMLTRVVMPAAASRHTQTVRSENVSKRLLLLLVALGITGAAVTLVRSGGLPLFMGEARFELTTVEYLSALLLVPFSLLYAIDRSVRLRRRVVAIALTLACLLSLGYRTPGLLILATLGVFGLSWGIVRFRMRWIFLGAGVVFGASWLNVWRFGAGSGEFFSILRRAGMTPEETLFAPTWVTLREGVAVASVATDAAQQGGTYGGAIFASMWLSLLPGEQTGPRDYFAILVSGRDGVTITPSIVGQPLLDWGMPGLLVFMFALGVLLTWSILSHFLALSPHVSLAMSFTVALCTLAIHSGILDPVLFIMCVSFWVLAKQQLKDG